MTYKIGEKIRNLRLQYKMTQEQLANRLGVSYQSVSRWENGITYPDIDFLPAIAQLFSISLDELFGENDEEKRKCIQKRIRRIGNMTEKDEEELIDLIRVCRREQDDGKYFENICYALRYSPLYQNSAVMEELRKSKDIFFETCTDASIRSQALEYYACLEEESHLRLLLERYASDKTTAKDFLLKERYLFRDDFKRFEEARQRYLHKQIVYMMDGDHALWRDCSRPMDAEYTLLENNTKLALLHTLCQEVPDDGHSITCGKEVDSFAEQRLFIGMRQACAHVKLGDIQKAYAVLEDIVELLEKVMALPDDAELSCLSFALSGLKIIVKSESSFGDLGKGKLLFYRLENGETEEFEQIFPKDALACLKTAKYARWGWLEPIRKETKFCELMKRIENLF